jgi:uncharacterized protein with beta-barrel porin domain
MTLLATTALTATAPAIALDATWSDSPGSNDISIGSNWVGGSVPTGTATFGVSSLQSLQMNASATMAGWTFTADHTGYGINAFGNLTFTGAGISNTGAGVGINAFGTLTLRNASTTAGANINGFGGIDFFDTSRAGGFINNFASLNFRDSSSAGTAGITNFGTLTFSGSSSAGTASIGNLSGTTTTFSDSSSAGAATISNAFSSTTTFNNNATAGSAEITNVWSGALTFNDSSTAGTATIINFESGITTFNGNSSAGGARIFNHLNTSLSFNGSSTAGTAQISTAGTAQFSGTSTAASSTITNYNSLTFLNNATAGAATISNRTNDTTIVANLIFKDSSTAGAAIITNALNSNLLFQDNSTAGTATVTNSGALAFRDGASASSATINNSMFLNFLHNSSAGSANITSSNVASFFHSSTAATATITNTGILNFWDSSTAASASITNSGNGSLTFLGSSTAGAAVIINSGTADFRDGSSAGTATITNSGSLFFSDSSTAGAAAITNSAGLSFSNSSTADSATIINNGFAQFEGTSTAGTAAITNGGLLAFLDASSTGNATITSTGMVQLATSNLTGAAAVTIQSGGLLSGYGSVGSTSIETGGIIMASGGTLRINGNLTLAAGSLYNFCTCSQIAATGTATLGGATLIAPQAAFQAQSYTVLTAAGGVTGTFAFGAGTTPFASLLYGTNDVTLTISAYRAGAALAGAGAANSRNVAAGLDRVLDGGATLPSAFDPILGLYAAPLARQLGAMTGEAGTAPQSTGLTGASTFLGIMLDPMGGSRGGTASAPGSSLIEMADMGAARTPAARVEAAWSIWTRAYGQAGRTASDAGLGAAGTASSVYGVAAGADKLIAPNLVVGFALAGGGTSFGLGTLGSGTGDFAQLGAYASMRLGPGYLSAALAYGWNRFDVTRNVAALGVTETYRSGPVGHTVGGRIETGRRFALGAYGVTPYAAAEAIAYIAPGYRETWVAPATGAFALAYAGRTTATLRGELGARADALVASAESGDLIAFSRLAYAVQANTQRTAEAQFQALAGSTFTVFGARASTHTALATLGVEARFRQGFAASLALDGEVGDRHRSLRGSVALRQSW